MRLCRRDYVQSPVKFLACVVEEMARNQKNV